VPRGVFRYIARRLAVAALLVVVSASAAFLLARAAPGDYLADLQLDPSFVAAERARLGLDRPLVEQYAAWLVRAARLDLGDSFRFRRPVDDLIRERAGNTILLAICALLLATAIGVPAGVVTGSRRRGAAVWMLRLASFVLLSVPPLIASLALLLLAARTGWFSTAGHLFLPSIALALPIAAVLERLQSRAMRDALRSPSILAALARGVPRRRVIWVHALRLSLQPVLAVYGVILGGVLSGSFVVEYVMSWPGLGDLMYEALVSRDLFLVAGCAAAGAAFLAAGVLAADLALLAVDPRAAGDTA
jgi:peptide/nickel transport system permease protein